PVDPLDDNCCHGPLLRLKLQPELVLDRGKDRWARVVIGDWLPKLRETRFYLGVLWPVFQLELEQPVETGFIQPRPATLCCQGHGKEGNRHSNRAFDHAGATAHSAAPLGLRSQLVPTLRRRQDIDISLFALRANG